MLHRQGASTRSFWVLSSCQDAYSSPLELGSHPFHGNVFDVPSVYPWLTYNAWAAKYGVFIHVLVFVTTMPTFSIKGDLHLKAFGQYVGIVSNVEIAETLFRIEDPFVSIGY